MAGRKRCDSSRLPHTSSYRRLTLRWERTLLGIQQREEYDERSGSQPCRKHLYGYVATMFIPTGADATTSKETAFNLHMVSRHTGTT